MKLAILAAIAALVSAAVAQDTQSYSDPKLGLSFSHPSTWTEKRAAPPPKAKKGKKGKNTPNDADSVTFVVPIEGSSQQAELTVVRASFSGSPETWQAVQVQANHNLKREVVRQWQQEILGVPMLLTRISYSEDGAATTALTGLLYTMSPYKLLFRLTGPSAEFDKVQFEFTTAMESLRTTDGALPVEQIPDVPVEPKKPEVKPDLRGVKKVLDSGSGASSAKYAKAPVAVPVSFSNHKVELRLPKDWTVADTKEATLTLKHPKLSAPITITIYSGAEADPPQMALLSSTAQSLSEFESATRDEPEPAVNRAGCLITKVWRIGKSAKGDLITFDASGVSGDFYFLASGRPGKNDRRLIETLMSEISVEPAP